MDAPPDWLSDPPEAARESSRRSRRSRRRVPGAPLHPSAVSRRNGPESSGVDVSGGDEGGGPSGTSVRKDGRPAAAGDLNDVKGGLP